MQCNQLKHANEERTSHIRDAEARQEKLKFGLLIKIILKR